MEPAAQETDAKQDPNHKAIEAISRVAHEVVTTIAESMGDFTRLTWDDQAEDRRQHARHLTAAYLNTPDVLPITLLGSAIYMMTSQERIYTYAHYGVVKAIAREQARPN